MRTTKVIAFSVPPEFEKAILLHAEKEHRTVSEYIREALRQYMSLRSFDMAQKAVSTKLKKKGVKAADVHKMVRELRR